LQAEQGIPNFESGRVLLSTGIVQVLEVNLTSTQININVTDKAFIKRVIAIRDELLPKSTKAEEEDNPPNVGGILSMVRSVAEMLCSRGITITVSYQDHRIVTIGAEANPRLLHYITKTRGVALNSFYTILRLMI
jgi:hypothetical protein